MAKVVTLRDRSRERDAAGEVMTQRDKDRESQTDRERHRGSSMMYQKCPHS